MSIYPCDLQKDPTSVLVYPHTLAAFFRIVGPVTVVTTKGRCIHVRKKGGVFPSWAELAQELLCSEKPCDEFHVDGANLYARLKRISQVCADEMASDGDGYGDLGEIFGGFGMVEAAAGISTDGISFLLGTEQPRAAQPAAKRSKKIPEGAAAVVLKAMKTASPSGAIDTEKLVAESIKLMPARKDTRGQDRRKDYAERAVRKLVETGHLYVHGDEQQQVSLTQLVTE